MSISRLAALGCFFAMLVAPATLLGANEYFWPEHHDVVEFKVKSHAIRGDLKLSLGSIVTIADKKYQEVMVDTKPNGLPGQSREVYLRADEKGVYSRYSKSPEDKEVLDLALPAEVGKTWQTYDRHGKPSKREIVEIRDCYIKPSRRTEETLFEGCVVVTFEALGGGAAAVFAPKFGEILYMRANGFDRRAMIKK